MTTDVRLLHATQVSLGGLARVVADLTAHQVEQGLEVHLLRPPGDMLDDLLHPGVRLHDWSISRTPGLGHLVAGRRLAVLADRIDASLVHLHSSAAGLAGRVALRGRRPTVMQPHAWSFHAVTGPFARAATSWERLAARWTDLIVCVGEGEREEGRQAGIDAEYALVPNGVDLDRWPEADDADRRTARDLLGLDPDVPTVVCIGRICRQKGQDLLLDAWPRVRASHPTATLHLVGDRQRMSIPDVDGVVEHRWSDRMWEWYAAADVVVLPSRWEGLPLTLLEAMAVGRPVVANRAVGNREVLAHLPESLVDAEHADDLAAALARRLDDPTLRRSEARSHRQRVELDYSLTGSVARTTAATLGLLDR